MLSLDYLKKNIICLIQDFETVSDLLEMMFEEIKDSKFQFNTKYGSGGDVV